MGFDPSNAVPGSYRASVFGAGLISIATLPVKVLCLGNKTSAGSWTADQDIYPVVGEAEADAGLGTGSECATVCYSALSVGGVSVYAAPVLEPSVGPVAATIAVLVGGIPARNGTLRFRVGGKAFAVGVASGEATTVTSVSITTAVNALIRAQVTASTSTSTSNITCRNTGTRGNQLLLWWDASDVPGLTLTVTGSTALHSNLVPFHNGAGDDTVAPVLALMLGDTYDYIASPHNDVANMGLIKTQLAAEALPGVSHLEHAIFAIFGTYSAATPLSNTTLNDQRSTLVWSANLENTVAWMVGKIAAKRASMVGQNPNFKWGGTAQCTLEGAQAHAYKGDNPGMATLKNALNNGLCVLKSEGADVVIVRGIVTKCLTGSSPDLRARDWADADVTDYVNKGVGALWTAVTAVNHYAEPDAANGAMPATGSNTPISWNGQLLTLMRGYARNNLVYLVEEHPPQSEWSTERACLMSAVPVFVKPKAYQLGANINHQAA
jgi:phage tail sheath gpL-like